MQLDLETRPGTIGRPNEDQTAVSSELLVLLDGAGTPAGLPTGCHHGVPWFVRNLAGQLLTHAAPAAGLTLAEALSAGIASVAALHRSTCDLNHPGTPSSTVVIARPGPDALEYLVLADSTLLIGAPEGTITITDNREATVGAHYRTPGDWFNIHSLDHQRSVSDYVNSMRSRRNTRDGFWVAAADPTAASEAHTGTIALHRPTPIALLSDGASRLFDLFGTHTPAAVLHTAHTGGATALLTAVRRIENTDPNGHRWPRAKTHDDATVITALIELTP